MWAKFERDMRTLQYIRMHMLISFRLTSVRGFPSTRQASLTALRAAVAQAAHGARFSVALHRLFMAITDASSDAS